MSRRSLPLEIGVDVGGTFTDVILSDSDGLHVEKVPTSSDPSDAILQGISRLGPRAIRAALFSHATTVATNALLTRSGLAKTAFVTNSGFRDILEIGRQRRPELYSLRARRPVPLVRRRDRFTVRGRVSAGGAVIEPLDREGASDVAATIAREGFESVAVCFLNSYANPVHEVEMRKALLRQGFRGNVSLSCEIDREYREYERSSTTAVNAVLVPLMSGYLSRLERSLRRKGAYAPLYIMNSDGGMSTSRFAATHPVAAVESGPAAGVLASRQLAKTLSLDKVLTFDMGGTTAKAGAVVGGEPEVVEEFEAAGRTHSGRSIRGSGYAVRGSFIDLAEVSAGGGTVAWIDEGGALAAGPRSAGSNPGPACYGTGGTEPTVTDANVVLGRLNPEHLLGGRMPISSSLARESLARLGERLGTDSEGAAEGVVRLVNNSMAKAMSIVSVERGRDPREFVMISFGGSGPVHTCDIAEELGVREVIVPIHAGMFSAYGLLVADLTRTFVSPVMGAADSLSRRFRELEALASEEMSKEGLGGFTLMRFVEARYQGQSHELLMPYRGEAALKRAFDRRHKEIYGYSTDDRLQVVNAKVKAVIRRGDVPSIDSASGGRGYSAGRRKAWFAGKTAAAPVLNRDGLRTGDGGTGPCIIEEYDSTLVVNPGWKWRVEPFGTRMRK
ncbi:MAG TPA: hydantoinase/oxoprolinase family protein [Nitrososphaerales archaeon]|nr:hydantoinase/oxoprolinase family protein [Nitrososphaerales archaeon]